VAQAYIGNRQGDLSQRFPQPLDLGLCFLCTLIFLSREVGEMRAGSLVHLDFSPQPLDLGT
jgi:hypothetical protein